MSAAHSLAPASQNNSDEALSLALLIASRICHDLASPIGAIDNGVEVLSDNNQNGLHADAVALTKGAVTTATARLQLFRMAFGAGTGEIIAGSELATTMTQYFEGGRIAFEWRAARIELPRPIMRIVALMVLSAQSTLLRGGKLNVGVMRSGQLVNIMATAEGPRAGLPERLRMMGPDSPLRGVEARDVHLWLLHRLLRDLTTKLEITEGADRVEFSATLMLPG